MARSASKNTAIVMGASIAGMWAARVLADHFDSVVVLERDRLPSEAAFRSGTPQARQYHVLLLRGLQLMDELFPGMRQELIAAGAVPFDTTGDVMLQSRGRWLELFRSDQVLLSCSRLLLEAAMRRRLQGFAQIRLLDSVEVTGLETAADRSGVTGVQVRWEREGEHPHGAETVLRGDLVVDALGRRSPTPAWLTGMGYQAPEESVIDSFLGYVTRRYRKPESVQRTWPAMLISATPPHSPRGGLILPEEGDTWVVMVAGTNKDYPPVDEEGFQAFARSLGPELFGVVAEGEAISRPYGYRGTESRWRHYERLERWPERLVVLGDAFCAFNPIYGQGMTVAALSAVALGQVLRAARGRPDGVARQAIRAIGKASEGAWLLATSADMEWPATAGGAQSQAPADRFARWYIGRLLDAMAYDRTLRLAFTEVNQLIKPATALFAPHLMLRVFQRVLRPALRHDRQQ